MTARSPAPSTASPGALAPWLLSAMMVAAMAACGDEQPQTAPAAATSSKAKGAAKADVVQDGNAFVPFVYTAVGKRDPFRSYLTELADQLTEHGPARKREETERYEIDQYRLTGLITGTSQPKAMVEDPASRGHVLHIGSRLGKNGGRVTHIAPTDIIVLEETRDPTGKKVRLPITIRLPRTELEDVVQR